VVASSGPLGVGTTFGPRYHIIKELGAGGMGAVYQAWDAELGVAVALKVIRPEVLKDPQGALDIERRFKRELLLARQVTHKNVVRIHDLGEIAGIKYITMSFVEGEDLATTLRREGRLDVPRVLRIARQVASGMHAAHEAGVVHRDLKPANVMLDRDRSALIMDFGIALSSGRGERVTTASQALPVARGVTGVDAPTVLDAAGSATTGPAAPPGVDDATVMATSPQGLRLTAIATDAGTVLSNSAGIIIGTLEYMAPEQSRGEAVDQRTDIYAFGLILSDLLLGRRSLKSGTSAWDELQARVSQPPVPLRERNAEIPEALDALVTRCVQIDAADRFQTTSDLIAGLDRIDENGQRIPEVRVRRLTPRLTAMATALVAVLVGGTYWLARAPAPAPPAPPPVSLLIADFQNNANDPAFSGPVEQALTVGVEGASFVTAYPRRDALRLAAQLRPGHGLDEATALLVALREGVQRVAIGAIDQTSDRYSLSVKVVDPSASRVVLTWSTEARTRQDVLAAVSRMAARIREELGDTTAGREPERAMESFSASSLDAARAYTAAQDLAQANKDEEAIALYRQAIAADARFGRAYAGWAVSAYRLGRTDEAAQLWERAMSLMDRMTERERYRTLGGYYLGIARNYDKAIENYSALVSRYPSDGAGLNSLGVAYFGSLAFSKALEQGRRAVEVYPRSALYRNNLALYAMYAGDFGTGASEARIVLKENPGFHKAYLPVVMEALDAGKPGEALDAYAAMTATSPRGASLAATGLSDMALAQGRLADARTALERGLAADVESGSRSAQAIKQVMLAEVHLAEGRRVQAAAVARAATDLSRSDAVVVPAARILLAAGQQRDVRALLDGLGSQLQKQSRAYARLIEADLALDGGRLADAVDSLTAAKGLADLWLVRFTLGRAYVQAGYAPEGLSELEACLKRRGEATAVFLDDVPTYRYIAPVYYWLARAQEGVALKADAAMNYQAYLDQRGNVASDPLAADARKRLAALK
jgi:serine/threonine protein kinase/tetratricopeptide (TPR) repeat protein